jgi:hypothetical protein
MKKIESNFSNDWNVGTSRTSYRQPISPPSQPYAIRCSDHFLTTQRSRSSCARDNNHLSECSSNDSWCIDPLLLISFHTRSAGRDGGTHTHTHTHMSSIHCFPLLHLSTRSLYFDGSSLSYPHTTDALYSTRNPSTRLFQWRCDLCDDTRKQHLACITEPCSSARSISAVIIRPWTAQHVRINKERWRCWRSVWCSW